MPMPVQPDLTYRPRSSAAAGWVRRHRVALHHTLWLLVSVAFVVESAALVGGVDDQAYADLRDFFVTAAVLGAGMTVIGLASQGDEKKRAATGGEPWRWPAIGIYAVVVPLSVFAAALDAAAPTTARDELLVWAVCMMIGVPSGVVVALVGLVLVICVAGVVGFGRPLLTGRAAGAPVSRAPYAGPFLAVTGLLSLPLVLAGAAGYDSPRRRDVLPLFGVLRDGVEVTHPTLLLVSQVATWWCVGGLVLGGLVAATIGRRSTPET